MSEVHILDRERAVEALARDLAFSKCFAAEREGSGFDADEPDDVERFYPSALRDAEQYMEIIEESG